MSDRIVGVHEYGSVELLEVMGSDQSVVDAARVSIKNLKPTSTNEKLIKYLMKNEHMSPFEMVEFKFRIKAPIFVAREWVRHRTANWNEISGRYAKLDTEFYLPAIDRMNKQSTDNKQGSSEELVERPEELRALIKGYFETVEYLYDHLLKWGLAKELARIVLPVATYTEWIWKIDLRNLLNFLELRMADNAQAEIAEYATEMLDLIQPHVPLVVAAWLDSQV